MSLEVGDILICRGKSWISRAIMKVTKGTWSHAAIFVSAWGQPCLIEAQANGVNVKLWKVWVKKWGYKYEVFRSKDEFDPRALTIKAFEKCGETKYDWFTFFRRGFGGRKKRSDKKENERMICSEFVAYVFDIPGGFDITPQELSEYLSTANFEKITP